jgi:hypothetical protein
MDWNRDKSSKSRAFEALASPIVDKRTSTTINVSIQRKLVDGKEQIVASANIYDFGTNPIEYTDIDKFCTDLAETIKASVKEL